MQQALDIANSLLSTLDAENTNKLTDYVVSEEYDYSKDSKTWLSESQQNELITNGYCHIDPEEEIQDVLILINGYVGIHYADNNDKAIIKIISQFYGTRWNADIFIELVSGGLNAKHFIIRRRDIALSKFVTTMIEGNEEQVTFLLNKVPDTTLEHILRYLSHHKGREPDPLPCPVRSIHMIQIVSDKWDAIWIDAFDKKTIYEIILAANSMDIKSLLNLGSAKIATLIKQMDQKEINRIIEEEEKYRREHAQNNDNDNNNDNDDDDNDDNNEDDGQFRSMVGAVSIDNDDDENDDDIVPDLIKQFSQDNL